MDERNPERIPRHLLCGIFGRYPHILTESGRPPETCLNDIRTSQENGIDTESFQVRIPHHGNRILGIRDIPTGLAHG